MFLAGCASVDMRLPDISDQALQDEQARQEKSAFQVVDRHRDRLIRVAHPILMANADICDKTRFESGAITHTLKSYSKPLRDGAARELGADDIPRLIYVRPGSPADKAGLKIGDQLLNEQGDPLDLPGAKARDIWDKGGSVSLLRDGIKTIIKIDPEERCGYDVRLKMTPTINAYATGRAIIVTSGMLDFVKNDDELALIIGHELAHNELSHVRKTLTNLVLSGLATRYTRPFESEADYVGMYYMARAGYDLGGVENIWRRLGQVSPRGIARAKTHPKYPSRFLRLAATRAEIQAKQAVGEPLLPNRKGDK